MNMPVWTFPVSNNRPVAIYCSSLKLHLFFCAAMAATKYFEVTLAYLQEQKLAMGSELWKGLQKNRVNQMVNNMLAVPFSPCLARRALLSRAICYRLSDTRCRGIRDPNKTFGSC